MSATEREALRSARKALEYTSTKLERIIAYLAKHGCDSSALSALAGLDEHIIVTAVQLANVTDSTLVMDAWGIIANAGGGDWQRTQTAEWIEAAERWRDTYVDSVSTPAADPAGEVGG